MNCGKNLKQEPEFMFEDREKLKIDEAGFEKS